MKKYLSYILPLVLSACTQLPMPPVSDLEELRFNGPVHTVAVIEYDAILENGEFVPLDTLTTRTITFSQDGRIEKMVHENGTELYYYEPGRRTIKRYDVDGESDHNEIADYDAKGDMIAWGMYTDEDSIMSREEYRYVNHRCVEKHVFNGKDKEEILVCRDYSYDEAGHLLAYSAFEPKGILAYKWNCAYNEQGKPVCEHWIDENDRVMSTDIYTYNDHGLKESEQSDLTRVEYTYELDSYGNYTTRVATFYSPGMNPNYIITYREIQYY